MAKLTKNQEKFCKEMVRNGGNRKKAYQQVFDVNDNVAAVSASRLMKQEKIRDAVGDLLEKQGMPRDFFVKKLKDLSNATDKDGNADHKTQFGCMKVGMELHGMLEKKKEGGDINVINYNVDNEKLMGVMEQLKQLTEKMSLIDYPKGDIEDADIIDEV